MIEVPALAAFAADLVAVDDAVASIDAALGVALVERERRVVPCPPPAPPDTWRVRFEQQAEPFDLATAGPERVDALVAALAAAGWDTELHDDGAGIVDLHGTRPEAHLTVTVLERSRRIVVVGRTTCRPAPPPG